MAPQSVRRFGRRLDQAAALCAAAERPLLWVGGGAKDAREGVAALATALGAPVIETYGGRGVLDPAAPIVAGAAAAPARGGELWDEADLVVAVGSDLDGMTTQNFAQPQPPRMVALNVDAADAAKNYAVDVVIEGDAPHTAAALAQALAAAAEAARPGCPAGGRPWNACGRRARRLRLDTMQEALDLETVVFADMCIPGYWLACDAPVRASAAAGLPGRVGHAWVRASRRRSAQRWPRTTRCCACAATAASCSPPASWPPWPRSGRR